MAPSRRRRSSSRELSSVVQRTSELPMEAANDMLAGFKGRLHTVKTQPLSLDDGTRIVIARVKVPTPKGISGHLIRRFDTEALSASNLFRVAFPHADDASETAEMEYLSKRYNTKQAGDEDENGSGKLTGVWIPIEAATELAREYGVLKFASELITFEAPTGPVSNNNTVSSPAAPTPRKSKSPAPPTSASRSKRARVTSPPVPASSISTRSTTSSMQSLAVPTTPSRSSIDLTADDDKEEEPSAEPAMFPVAEQQEEIGGIQVTQEVITDNETGQVYEETKVTFKGADAEAITGGSEGGLMGTDEQAREAVENARRLIESLKEDGVLQSGATKRTREVEDEENEQPEVDGEEEEQARPGVFRRMFGRKQPTSKRNARIAPPRAELGELQVMQSPDGAQVLVAQTAPPPQANRRRFIAMAGMVVLGAASAAAPYFI